MVGVGVLCLPDLQRVMFLRIFLRSETDHFAGFEKRRTVTDDRRIDLLLNEVVPQVNIGTALAVVEDIEKVFTVGRSQPFFEDHIGEIGLEGLALAVLQVIAVSKDQAMVVGEQDAGLFDRIQSPGLLDLLVVDNVAGLRFLVGSNPQQHQVTDNRITDVRIVECLVRLFHRFTVEAFTTVGIVFDLDREVTAHRLDKDAVVDRNVRILALMMHIAGGPCPAEFVLGRVGKLVLAAGIHINQCIAADDPLENLDIADVLTDTKHKVNMRTRNKELGKLGVFVIAKEIGEIFLEAVVLEPVQRLLMERPLLRIKRVYPKHIREMGFAFQSQKDVVPKEKPGTDRHQVARHTVVRRGNPLGPQQGRFDRPKDLFTAFVELIEPRAQFLTVPVETVTNNFVGTAFEFLRWARFGR